MRSYPFPILITIDERRLIATHITVEIREDNGELYVSGQVAFGNEQKILYENTEALLIFQGPLSYISSSWYEGETVPTWDYVAVHEIGRPRIVSGNELDSALAHMFEFMNPAAGMGCV